MTFTNFGQLPKPADREPNFEIFMASRMDELDKAIFGYESISLAGLSGNVDLTSTQARYVVIELTGAPSAAATVRIPAALGANAEITFVNNCSGSFSTVTIKSTGANSDNSAGVSILTGKTRKVRHNGNSVFPVASEIGSLSDAWASWTPTWTNLTLGNGTVVAKFIEIGKLVFCRLSLVFGSTTAVTGQIQFTLPVAAVAYGGTMSITQLAGVGFFDASAVLGYDGYIALLNTTKGVINAKSVVGANITVVATAAAVPFAWAVSDEINLQIAYEKA